MVYAITFIILCYLRVNKIHIESCNCERLICGNILLNYLINYKKSFAASLCANLLILAQIKYNFTYFVAKIAFIHYYVALEYG